MNEKNKIEILINGVKKFETELEHTKENDLMIAIKGLIEYSEMLKGNKKQMYKMLGAKKKK